MSPVLVVVLSRWTQNTSLCHIEVYNKMQLNIVVKPFIMVCPILPYVIGQTIIFLPCYLKGAARGSLQMQDPKKVAKTRHLGTIPQLCWAVSSQLRHVSTIGKKLVKQQYVLHMSPQYGELRPTSG